MMERDEGNLIFVSSMRRNRVYYRGMIDEYYECLEGFIYRSLAIH